MHTLSSAFAGVGSPRSGAASLSACHSDSATNGITGCTSRRMPSSTPTSTRCASRARGRVLAAGPSHISMYQSQNSVHTKSYSSRATSLKW